NGQHEASDPANEPDRDHDQCEWREHRTEDATDDPEAEKDHDERDPGEQRLKRVELHEFAALVGLDRESEEDADDRDRRVAKQCNDVVVVAAGCCCRCHLCCCASSGTYALTACGTCSGPVSHLAATCRTKLCHSRSLLKC